MYNGSLLVAAKISNGINMYFLYDATGEAIGFDYDDNGTVSRFYYQRLITGEIAGIISRSGTQQVEYLYEAWGNILSVSGSLAATVGYYNPLKYKGYVYDEEAKLYYLQSRYYDPQVTRFLNADAQLNIGQSALGANMFAYCDNNPVNKADPGGHVAFFVVTGLVGAVIGAIVGAAKTGTVKGAFIGAVAGALIGAGAGAAAGAVLAGSFAASTTAVMVGGAGLVTTLSTGGAGAAATYIANNVQHAVNRAEPVVSAAAAKMQQVVEKGKTGELMSGLEKTYKHITSLTETAAYRIPDALDDTAKILCEVKNYSGTLYYTKQLQDFVLWSQKYGYEMRLYTSAQLSTPLQQLVDAGIVKIYF